MEKNNFGKWSDKIGSMLPDSALKAKADIQKNLSFLINEAIQKMDLVDRTQLEEQEKRIKKLESKLEELEARQE
ncbi:MAG: accessory factor UbiK family protein [Gammaproteobacteria bacterium]|jgi:BMFP domain-containing protein YqiC|nr:accessory factor UbiK family protein [Gammaproteobacteria bacterium]MDG2434416.1 accessory factor UbiK family protein [Gammaproteobacteria bacterium]